MDTGILFDVQGTLFVYGDMKAAWTDWVETFRKGLVPSGLDLSPEAFAASCDQFFARPYQDVDHTQYTIYERRIVAHCQALGLDVPRETVCRIADDTQTAWQGHVPLDPEALPTLDRLAENYVLGAVSNYDHPRQLRRLLDDAGLTPYFKTIVISGEEGVKKPDPRILHIAMEKAGLEPGHTVYIGDTDEDVEASVGAGVRPVRIDRDGDGSRAGIDFRTEPENAGPMGEITGHGETVIASLSELPDVLGMNR